jgi:single-strand selective monofunctional uracil DNA glycosylase
VGDPQGERLAEAAFALARCAGRLSFAPPVGWVYNPLLYAREPARSYMRMCPVVPGAVVFMGMNPGPWGMAQTGVPFGEVAAIRDWMGVTGKVGKPAREHARVPVSGFSCGRSEVSGRRLWGLIRERYGTPGEFFRGNYVANYCPLLFLDQQGRNLTPDKLSRADRDRLFALCDRHALELIAILRPGWLIAVGRFVEERLQGLSGSLGGELPRIGRIPHPSPASPAANRDWAGQASTILTGLGAWK